MSFPSNAWELKQTAGWHRDFGRGTEERERQLREGKVGIEYCFLTSLRQEGTGSWITS